MKINSNSKAGKIAEVSLVFWVMKICATTLGETAGDLLSMTLKVGYLISTAILLGVFVASFAAQLTAKCYRPWIYWSVILSTSTAGTTMSDFIDRTLHVGYLYGSLILFLLLVIVLIVWRLVIGTLAVDHISDRKTECFYWAAILVSNTLGTALGDYLADSSGLGFAGGALLIGVLIGLIALANFFTKLSKIWLFWLAFVLTRPFGATFGDLMTKTHESGGLDLGTGGSSAVLLALLVGLLFYTSIKKSNLTVS
jgi:uncharacterized membrane-anchored protein